MAGTLAFDRRHETFVAVTYLLLVVAYNLEGVIHQTTAQGCGGGEFWRWLTTERKNNRKKEGIDTDDGGCDADKRRIMVSAGEVPACRVTETFQATADWWSRHLLGWPFVHDSTSTAHCKHCARQHVDTMGQRAVRPTCVLASLDTIKALKDTYDTGTVTKLAQGAGRAASWGGACMVAGPLGAAACAVGSFALTMYDVVSEWSDIPRVVDLVVVGLLLAGVVLRMMPRRTPLPFSVTWAGAAALLAHSLLLPIFGLQYGRSAAGGVLTVLCAAAAGFLLAPYPFEFFDPALQRRVGLVVPVYYNPNGWHGRTFVMAVWVLGLFMWRSCESYERMMAATITEYLTQKLLSAAASVFASMATAWTSWTSMFKSSDPPLVADPSTDIFTHVDTAALLRNGLTEIDYNVRESPAVVLADRSRRSPPVVCTHMKKGTSTTPVTRLRTRTQLTLDQIGVLRRKQKGADGKAVELTHIFLNLAPFHKDARDLGSERENARSPAWRAIELDGIGTFGIRNSYEATMARPNKYGTLVDHLRTFVELEGLRPSDAGLKRLLERVPELNTPTITPLKSGSRPGTSAPVRHNQARYISTKQTKHWRGTLTYVNLDGDESGVGRPKSLADAEADPMLQCAMCEADAAIRRDTWLRDKKMLPPGGDYWPKTFTSFQPNTCPSVRESNRRAFYGGSALVKKKL